MLLALSPWARTLWVVSMLTSAIQYPLYGLLLGYAHGRDKLAPSLMALSAAHVLAVIICFAVDPRQDWRFFI